MNLFDKLWGVEAGELNPVDFAVARATVEKVCSEIMQRFELLPLGGFEQENLRFLLEQLLELLRACILGQVHSVRTRLPAFFALLDRIDGLGDQMDDIEGDLQDIEQTLEQIEQNF